MARKRRQRQITLRHRIFSPATPIAIYVALWLPGLLADGHTELALIMAGGVVFAWVFFPRWQRDIDAAEALFGAGAADSGPVAKLIWFLVGVFMCIALGSFLAEEYGLGDQYMALLRYVAFGGE